MDKENHKRPKIGTTLNVKRLLKQLKKHSESNLQELGDWPSEGLDGAIEDLVNKISKDSRDVRKAFEEETKILETFEEIYQEEPESVSETLIESLQFNKDDEIRKSAAYVIGFLKISDAQEAIAGSLMGDPYSATREKAAYALGEYDLISSLEPLIYAIENDNSYWVRAEAAWALGKIGTQEASKVLMKALKNDPEGWVRTSIAAVLEEFSKDIIPDLLDVYTKEEDMQVKAQIEKTVKGLRKKENEEAGTA